MTRFTHTHVQTIDEWRVAAAINDILSRFSDSAIEGLHVKRVKGNHTRFTVELSNRYAAQAFYIMFSAEWVIRKGLPVTVRHIGHYNLYITL